MWRRIFALSYFRTSFKVHKVCANHQLLPGMTIQAMPRQEKAMMWYCEDFSEEQKSHEKLSARFASVEVANKFKEVFENSVKKAGHGMLYKLLLHSVFPCKRYSRYSYEAHFYC